MMWKAAQGSKVLVLGIAYKKMLTMRESPSVLLMELLQARR